MNIIWNRESILKEDENRLHTSYEHRILDSQSWSQDAENRLHAGNIGWSVLTQRELCTAYEHKILDCQSSQKDSGNRVRTFYGTENIG